MKVPVLMLVCCLYIIPALGSQDLVIDGISYLSNDHSEPSFHETGQFRHGTLAKEQVINGLTYMKDSKIWFDENGQARTKF